MPQEQFHRVKQNQNPNPASSQEDRDSTVTACTGRDVIQHWAHGTRTLEKTFEERDTPKQAVVRIVNRTARAWRIQYEIRVIITPASTKQAMEMQAEAQRRKREEILQSEGDQQSEISLARRKPQDCDSVEQQSSSSRSRFLVKVLSQVARCLGGLVQNTN